MFFLFELLMFRSLRFVILLGYVWRCFFKFVIYCVGWEEARFELPLACFRLLMRLRRRLQ